MTAAIATVSFLAKRMGNEKRCVPLLSGDCISATPLFLALVLVFIGSKIFLVGIIGKIPPVISLSVTFGLIAGGVLVSLWKTRGHPRRSLSFWSLGGGADCVIKILLESQLWTLIFCGLAVLHSF